MPMESRRWINPYHPQTLQIAVWLLYLNGLFALLFGGIFSRLGIIAIGAAIGGAFGIANNQRWGYWLGIFAAILPFLLRIAFGAPLIGVSLINFMFEVALVALLLHPMSRDYQRIYFE